MRTKTSGLLPLAAALASAGIVPAAASAVGEHLVRTSFMPQEIRHALDQQMDFLDPITADRCGAAGGPPRRPAAAAPAATRPLQEYHHGVPAKFDTDGAITTFLARSHHVSEGLPAAWPRCPCLPHRPDHRPCRVPAAKALARDAVAVLVFPKITKAGLVVGGQYGEGVLFRGDAVVGHYNTAGASFGLQAGAQEYGYAMFFMNERSLAALTETDGFEVGVGPSVVMVDQGIGKSLTTMNAKEDIYAFVFGQKGLMAGIGLQGNKITRLKD